MGVLGEDFESQRFADLGAGSGYYVAALLKEGARYVSGYEVSETQLKLASAMIEGASLHLHNLEDIEQIIRSADAEVFSMVGVLEHVRHPRETLKAIRSNKRAKYIYISVPTFSPSVYLEAVSPEIFHRQLGAGHTHLYTDSSLQWMCQEFGLTRVGEWWFGTDIVDLFRHVGVRLGQNPTTSALSDRWYESLADSLDGLQLQLDQRKLSSEVHMVLKVD